MSLKSTFETADAAKNNQTKNQQTYKKAKKKQKTNKQTNKQRNKQQQTNKQNLGMGENWLTQQIRRFKQLTI